MKDSYLGQAWLVLALGATLGGALAGVHVALKDRIATNKKAETYRNIPVLVPGSDEGKTVEMTIAGRKVYQARSADDRLLGWVVPAKGQGFADAIELLIGLDARAEKITGLAVLDQKETPGLGNKIADRRHGRDENKKFLDWFEDENPAARLDTGQPISVVKREPVKGANEIQAITGATISSESVTAIVDATVKALRGELAQAAEKE